MTFLEAIEEMKKGSIVCIDRTVFRMVDGKIKAAHRAVRNFEDIDNIKIEYATSNHWQVCIEPTKYKTVKAWFFRDKESGFADVPVYGPFEKRFSTRKLNFIQEIQIPESQEWEFEE